MSEPATPHLHQAALDEVVALATDLARRIHQAATGPEPTLSLEQASVALDRTARTLRRTVLLARRLADLPPLPTPSPDAEVAARKQVIRAVEDAIHTRNRDNPDNERALRAELLERLDREDFARDLLTRPVPELIAELRQDLGVAFQHRSWVFLRRTPTAVDQLNTRAERRPPPPS